MNCFRAGGIGNGFSVRGPNHPADAHIVERRGGFGSIGKPADDQIASLSRALLFRAIAANKRDAFPVRRRNESTAAVWLAPRRLGLASRRGDLPQLCFVHETNALALFAPERIGHSAFGKRRKRDRQSAAICI